MEGLSMDAPTISVIIPFYNAELYLPECISSVRECRETALECILVNDGSTDNSRTICESVISEDSRFRLINKDNSGVSDSRNAGIRAARGKYLFFLDSDDFIDTSQWPRIFHYANGPDTDLIAFGYFTLFPTYREKKEYFAIAGETSCDRADLLSTLVATPMLNTCWGKLLKRSVIEENGLLFDVSLVTCEDAVFLIDFAEKSHTFILCNHCVLYYRIHSSSATHQRPLKRKLEDFSILFSRRSELVLSFSDYPLRNSMLREGFSVLTNILLEFSAYHKLGEIEDACMFIYACPITNEILGGLDSHSLFPLYKKLEYKLMKRRLRLLLSVYFKLKSRFIGKHNDLSTMRLGNGAAPPC